MPEPITEEQRTEWEQWLAERPEKVREVAERLPPWKDYVLTTTGQHCVIKQYDEHEDGHVTLTIIAWQEWFPLPRGVFGIDPDTLEERVVDE